jgi:hypothetical protein
MKKVLKIVLVTVLAVHAYLVLSTAFELKKKDSGPGYQEELQLWFIVAVVDFPVTLILEEFDRITEEFIYSNFSDIAANIWFPTFVYLILGSVQWTIIILAPPYLINKMRIQPVASGQRR